MRQPVIKERGLGHGHHHGGQAHSHAPANYSTAFAVGVALNLCFVIAEVIYGRLAHSLALVADAGHNLSDALGLALAWGAIMLSRRRPTKERIYGFRRSSILAALINAAVLLISVGALAWEAIRRLSTPNAVVKHSGGRWQRVAPLRNDSFGSESL